MRSWREIRVMMKWRFADLNDADFEIIDGDKERTLDKLANKLQKTRVELERLIAELQHY